jgi:hypothetical protein
VLPLACASKIRPNSDYNEKLVSYKPRFCIMFMNNALYQYDSYSGVGESTNPGDQLPLDIGNPFVSELWSGHLE